MTAKPKEKTEDQGPTVAALVRESFYRLFADEAIPLAGNIAFRTVFSVFPFLIFLTALAGFFGNDNLAEGVRHLPAERCPRKAGRASGAGDPRRSSPCRAPASSPSRR